MANSYFNFKQFRIEQGQTAMKVGTDGVLLGAWTNVDQVASILDVGTGTGMIALMMAQRTNASVVGVELDEQAATQARDNAAASLFCDRVSIANQAFQEFASQGKASFDLIISNPPFFENGAKAPVAQRSVARHADETLPFEDLVSGASALLSTKGVLSVILPVWSEQRFEELALAQNLFLKRRMEVRHTTKKASKRVLLEYARKKEEVIREELVIRDGDDYSRDYKELTKAFYLAF